MKELQARLDSADIKLNQSPGAFWIPETKPLGEDRIESGILKTQEYSNGGATHYIEGTAEMHKKLVGKRIPLLGSVKPEENTSLAFYMAVASRDYTNAEGTTMTHAGDSRVVLLPA